MSQPRPRPVGRQYSPTVLADDVAQLLTRAGVRTTAGAQLSLSARIAAAQLLEALGVQPVTVPQLPDPSAT